jgi:FkbM family methyltransferase
MIDDRPEVEYSPNEPRSAMMRLRMALYPHRRHLKWLRLVARWQMKLPLDPVRQWRFCRWVSLLTTDPEEQVLWKMPGTSLSLSLDLVETIQMNLYYCSAFQPEIMHWVRRNLRSDRIFIDAGANVGIHTLMAAEFYRENLGLTARPVVFAFEPNPRIFGKLEANIRRNNLEAFVSPQQSAVSDRDGWTCFFLSRRDNSTSSSLASLGPGHQHTGEMVQVHTIDLSTFVRRQANQQLAGLIKLDIEGAELPALRGARELLVQDRPVLIVEVYPALTQAFGYSFGDLREFLRTCGYVLYRIQPDRTLANLSRDEWPPGIQYGDVICFPHERDSDRAGTA